MYDIFWPLKVLPNRNVDLPLAYANRLRHKDNIYAKTGNEPKKTATLWRLPSICVSSYWISRSIQEPESIIQWKKEYCFYNYQDGFRLTSFLMLLTEFWSILVGICASCENCLDIASFHKFLIEEIDWGYQYYQYPRG